MRRRHLRLHAACPGGGGGISAINVATCTQPIDNASGYLRCGPASPTPTVTVSQVVSSTLAKAKADIQAAGLTIKHMDSSCGGQLDGSSVDITRCVPPPVTDTAGPTCSATYMTLCAICPGEISGDKKSQFAGYSCASESDTIDALQQQFVNCTVQSGACAF